MLQRAKLFVGSSHEAVKAGAVQVLVDVLKKELPHVEIVRWDRSPLWKNLKSALQSLEDGLADFSYAVFLAYPDDEVTIRKDTYLTVRDNVLFEFGLFLSHLGTERTFLITPMPAKIPLPAKVAAAKGGVTEVPFRIPSDLTGGFHAGNYKMFLNGAKSKKYTFDFRIADLVKTLKTFEQQRIVTAERAMDLLKHHVTRLQGEMVAGHPDTYYLGKMRNAFEALMHYKALGSKKSIPEAVSDLLLYFENLPDLCNLEQLPEIQSWRKGIKKVWVLADGPLEFEARSGKPFQVLRDVIRENLAKGVKYTYYVPSTFDMSSVNNLVPKSRANRALRRNICVIKTDARLFKTYFTVHFQKRDVVQSVYMSSVMKGRRDLLIKVSEEEHSKRIHRCIRALRGNAQDVEQINVIDLVTT